MTEEEIIKLYQRMRGSKKIFKTLWKVFTLISYDKEDYLKYFDSFEKENDKLIECVSQLIFIGEYFNSWIDVWSDYFVAAVYDTELLKINDKRSEITGKIFKKIMNKDFNNLLNLVMTKEWDELKTCIRCCLSIPSLSPMLDTDFVINWNEYISLEHYRSLWNTLNSIK